jgi:hypothetical protein
MTIEERKEIFDDVTEFIAQSETHPEKSYCLVMNTRQGKYYGSNLEIHKQSGRHIRFIA